jgi:hypothetical protein
MFISRRRVATAGRSQPVAALHKKERTAPAHPSLPPSWLDPTLHCCNSLSRQLKKRRPVNPAAQRPPRAARRGAPAVGAWLARSSVLGPAHARRLLSDGPGSLAVALHVILAAQSKKKARRRRSARKQHNADATRRPRSSRSTLIGHLERAACCQWEPCYHAAQQPPGPGRKSVRALHRDSDRTQDAALCDSREAGGHGARPHGKRPRNVSPP